MEGGGRRHLGEGAGERNLNEGGGEDEVVMRDGCITSDAPATSASAGMLREAKTFV
jgi:hypothetical protein